MSRTTRVVAALVALLALAGCSGPSTQTLNDAVTATVALPGVEVDLSGSTLVGSGSAGGTFVARGDADLATDSRALTVEIRPAGADASTTEVLVDEGTNYQRGLPGLPEDQWVLVEGAPPAISADLPTFVDPLALLNLLTSLTGTVTDLGPDTVRGEPVQHLQVILPPARLERSIAGILNLLGSELVAEVASVGDITARGLAEVWVDEEGWVRQLRLATTAGVGPAQSIPGTGAIDNEILLTLTPLDQTPEIDAPPTEQTARTTFADLFRR